MTEDDITRGKRCDFLNCPIALATIRALNDVRYLVKVDGEIAILTRKEYSMIATMPDECAHFVKKCDTGEAIEPMDPFVLNFVRMDRETYEYRPRGRLDTRYTS